MIPSIFQTGFYIHTIPESSLLYLIIAISFQQFLLLHSKGSVVYIVSFTPNTWLETPPHQHPIYPPELDSLASTSE